MLPPGYYTPLPPALLLGAKNLRQRDEISIAVIRHFATKPFKYRFVSFEGEEGAEHDPSPQLLRRIKALKLPVRPVSSRKERVIEDGEKRDSDQATLGASFTIFSIAPISDDRVDVDVNECPGFGAGGVRAEYSLQREHGQWKVIKDQEIAIF
jgi:hypothetical protein